MLFFFCFVQNCLLKATRFFFDSKWKTTIKDSAVYYRIKPLKIKTKKAIGHKIDYVDSLYIIKDYYIKNNIMQFEGYTTDAEGNYNRGKAKWYNEDGSLLFSRDFEKPAPGTFRVPDRPITYLNYSITDKSLLTLGSEFCLDCKSSSKLFLGLGFGVTNSCNGNYYGLPDLHLSYNMSFLLFLKSGITNRNTYVQGGISLFNAIDLGFGYSFPFNRNDNPVMEGFTAGITYRITKNKKAYNPLRIGY